MINFNIHKRNMQFWYTHSILRQSCLWTILILSYQGRNLIPVIQLFMNIFVLAVCFQCIRKITFDISFIKINFHIQNTAPKTMMLWQPLFIVNFLKIHFLIKVWATFPAYENCINSYCITHCPNCLVCWIYRGSFVMLFIIE